MPTVVVRYRPKADQADHNQSLVEAVFADLVASEPDGLGYATFVHIADVRGETNPLTESAAFTDAIADRCEPGEAPNAQPAALVGNYRLLAD